MAREEIVPIVSVVYLWTQSSDETTFQRDSAGYYVSKANMSRPMHRFNILTAR
jgi:hypothetical protein